MRLEHFPEVNRVYAKDQPQYRPLPCHAVPHDDHGRIIFCWRLSLWQRLRVLWSGTLWHTVLTFHQPLQPQLLEHVKPEMRGLGVEPPFGHRMASVGYKMASDADTARRYKSG